MAFESRSITPPSRKASQSACGTGSLDGSEIPDDEEPPQVVLMHTVSNFRDPAIVAHAICYDHGEMTIRPSSRAEAWALETADRTTGHRTTTARPVHARARTSMPGLPPALPGAASPGGKPRPASAQHEFTGHWVRHHWMSNTRLVPAPPESQLRRVSPTRAEAPAEGAGDATAAASTTRRIPLEDKAERKRPQLRPMRSLRPNTAQPFVLRVASGMPGDRTTMPSGGGGAYTSQISRAESVGPGGTLPPGTMRAGFEPFDKRRDGVYDADPLYAKYLSSLRRGARGLDTTF